MSKSLNQSDKRTSDLQNWLRDIGLWKLHFVGEISIHKQNIHIQLIMSTKQSLKRFEGSTHAFSIYVEVNYFSWEINFWFCECIL